MGFTFTNYSLSKKGLFLEKLTSKKEKRAVTKISTSLDTFLNKALFALLKRLKGFSWRWGCLKSEGQMSAHWKPRAFWARFYIFSLPGPFRSSILSRQPLLDTITSSSSHGLSSAVPTARLRTLFLNSFFEAVLVLQENGGLLKPQWTEWSLERATDCWAPLTYCRNQQEDSGMYQKKTSCQWKPEATSCSWMQILRSWYT